MTGFTDRVCAALEDLLRSRTEWDEAPDLHFMYAQGGQMRLSEPEAVVPSRIWAGSAPPTYKLSAMADALCETLPPGFLPAIAPGALVAVVFRFETWSVIVPEAAGLAARKHAQAMQAERMLSAHPDKVESRMAWAVTRQRTHWFASLQRGSGAVKSGPAPSPQGLVPESLEKMMGAFTAGAN